MDPPATYVYIQLFCPRAPYCTALSRHRCITVPVSVSVSVCVSVVFSWSPFCLCPCLCLSRYRYRSPSAWHDHWHCMSHVSPSSHVANYPSASRIVRPRTRTRTRLRARLEVITSHHIISLRVSKCGTTPNPAHVLVLVLVLVLIHVNTVLYHDAPRPYAYTYAPITALLRPPSTLYVV